MDQQKLYLQIVRQEDKIVNNVAIQTYSLESITFDKKIYYQLPDDKRDSTCHQLLFQRPSVSRAANSIRPIGGIRNIHVIFKEDLRAIYLDEEENLAFEGTPLEEILPSSDYSIISNKSEEETHLLKQIAQLQKYNQKLEMQRDEIKLSDVEKKLIIDKFTGKQNTRDWLDRYETECARNKINNSTKMIEALRFFVDGSAKDWYEGNLKKLDISKWSAWRESLLLIYADKGWTSTRLAHQYKYLAGSLTDYALKKERLCLEFEKGMTMQSRIGMVVVNLPVYIQDKLDREDIKSMNDLYTELRKLDDSCLVKKKYSNEGEQKFFKKEEHSKSQTNTKPTNGSNKSKTDGKKEACFMCTFLGLTNPPRYHAPKDCSNKVKYASKLQSVNCILQKEAGESDDSDEIANIMNIELESSDPKHKNSKN